MIAIWWKAVGYLDGDEHEVEARAEDDGGEWPQSYVPGLLPPGSKFGQTLARFNCRRRKKAF
ncbi:GD15592 [Drosophila simulans]|uniref:GD15592 n=1 Tax=Drosophila simulans TaxID=7240 RepID=B4R7C8_DROSI|nr:GD15592 [Drosophila simulans]